MASGQRPDGVMSIWALLGWRGPGQDGVQGEGALLWNEDLHQIPPWASHKTVLPRA